MAKMKLAAKFHMPVICLIDTPGAYPGIGAEERGQAQVIASSMFEMSRLPTPVICVVIGEGGSGGALGIGVGDRVAMLEHAYYSVISPEGCAGILWKSHTYKEQAAQALKMTSKDLLRLGVIDDVIREPLGGAHRDHHLMANRLKIFFRNALRELIEQPIDQLAGSPLPEVPPHGRVPGRQRGASLFSLNPSTRHADGNGHAAVGPHHRPDGGAGEAAVGGPVERACGGNTFGRARTHEPVAGPHACHISTEALPAYRPPRWPLFTTRGARTALRLAFLQFNVLPPGAGILGSVRANLPVTTDGPWSTWFGRADAWAAYRPLRPLAPLRSPAPWRFGRRCSSWTFSAAAC